MKMPTETRTDVIIDFAKASQARRSRRLVESIKQLPSQQPGYDRRIRERAFANELIESKAKRADAPGHA